MTAAYTSPYHGLERRKKKYTARGLNWRAVTSKVGFRDPELEKCLIKILDATVAGTTNKKDHDGSRA